MPKQYLHYRTGSTLNQRPKQSLSNGVAYILTTYVRQKPHPKGGNPQPKKETWSKRRNESITKPGPICNKQVEDRRGEDQLLPNKTVISPTGLAFDLNTCFLKDPLLQGMSMFSQERAVKKHAFKSNA